MTYGNANHLNILLGKLNTKELNSTDYIGVLRLKNKTKKIATELQEMQSEIHKEYAIEFNFDGSAKIKPNEIEKMNLVSKALETLMKGEVEIDGTNFLSMEAWELLRKSNDLVMSEHEILVEWLVKLD